MILNMTINLAFQESKQYYLTRFTFEMVETFYANKINKRSSLDVAIS
jgi:hypothetical protein